MYCVYEQIDNHTGEHIIIGWFDGWMSFGLILRWFWNGRFHEDDLRYSLEHGPLLKVAAKKKWKGEKIDREEG